MDRRIDGIVTLESRVVSFSFTGELHTDALALVYLRELPVNYIPYKTETFARYECDVTTLECKTTRGGSGLPYSSRSLGKSCPRPVKGGAVGELLHCIGCSFHLSSRLVCRPRSRCS